MMHRFSRQPSMASALRYDRFMFGRLIGRLGLIVFALIVAIASAARASTIDVPGDYPTIQGALDAVTYDDTVVVAPGTYFESGLRFPEVRCTLIGDRAVVDAAGNDTLLSVIAGSDVLQINGFTFTGALSPSSSVYLGGGHVTFRNTTFQGNVAEESLFDVRTTVRTENCRFRGNDALYVFNVSGFLAILNGIVADNECLRTLAVDWAGRVTVQNSTVANNSGDVWLLGYMDIFNSIFWNPAAAGELMDIYSTPVVTYSDVRGGWPGEGNIDADPLFRSYRGFDYVLGIGSPCIDAGYPTLEDGVSDWHPRWPEWYPNGPRSDMGAYGGPNNVKWLTR